MFRSCPALVCHRLAGGELGLAACFVLVNRMETGRGVALVRRDAQRAYNEVMGIVGTNPKRTKRFNLRATPKQERLIRVAAARRGVNVTDFILDSACRKAEEALHDQTRFVVDQRAWDRFMTALDAPPKFIPQIGKLFSKPSVAESR